MSSALSDLVVQLNRAGCESSFNSAYGTIDIVRVAGRPLHDPWALAVTPAQIDEIVASLARREGVGRADAKALLAATIAVDVHVYGPRQGPFRLDQNGYAVPAGTDEDGDLDA